jgi:AcrR family transcriptional regulator
MAAPRKENVKEIIISATERLLADKRFSDISLADIAKAAEISKGTLYYHYKSKNEILFDITDRYLDEQWRNLIEWTENKEKDTSLHRLVMYVMERGVSTAQLRVHLFYDAILGNEEIRTRLIRRYSEFEEMIAKKIAERTDAVPAGYFAWLILLASDGLLIQSLLRNEAVDSKAFIAQSTEYIKKKIT